MTTTKAQEKFVTVNGVRLHYLDWGGEGKPALVCLHGHTSQLHIWDEFAEAMAPSYHVYTVDQRGHGDSAWAMDGYERDQFVADLHEFLDALSIDRVTLVGLSMGGWNTMLYAAAHPERVERAVLVDIAPEVSQATRGRQRPPMPLEFSSFEEAVQWGRPGNPGASEERHRKDMADRLRQRGAGKWTWKADPALFNRPLRDGSEQEIIARYWRSLEALQCPLLEVRGTLSDLVSNEIIERMKKANSLISAVDVEGAGHSVPVDRPGEFVKVVSEFLGLPIGNQY